VRFARPDAGVTEVSLNGVTRQLLWAPYACTLPLKAGENTVSVTLTNSCRNLFGPHYCKDGDMYNVWPGGFARQTAEMYFLRFGIEGGIEILY
jgi:hypothetical protein